MTWQYIAGFFDGEGCVSKTKQRNPYTVTLAQSEHQHDVLFRIQEFLNENGIVARIDTPKSVAKNMTIKKRLVSYVRITDQKSVLSFLVSVLPFIIVKRNISLTAIEAAKGVILRKEHSLSKKPIAVKMYSEGFSLTKIEKALKMDAGTIREAVVKAGIPIRPLGTNQFSPSINSQNPINQ